jgi:hypothetical protein
MAGCFLQAPDIVSGPQKYDLIEIRKQVEAGKTTATRREEIKEYDEDKLSWVGSGRFEMRPCRPQDLFK